MKKNLLLLFSVVLCLSAKAQVTQNIPNSQSKTKAHASSINSNTNSPSSNSERNQVGPLRTNSLHASDESIIGDTWYDIQTNSSISNRIVVSDDGTISAVWTFSPTNDYTTDDFFPYRGTGYNFWNGSAWLDKPSDRTEDARTGFTNIVVTPISELTVAHSIANGTGSEIVVNRRDTKGSGLWTLSRPWAAANDTWAKAVSAGTSGSNNNVYVIFNGSGVATTPIDGQTGPIYFSMSTDGGATFTAKKLIAEIDSNHYSGFSADNYSIDAKGDFVAITASDVFSDVVLLKSADAGATWLKTIIQKNPIPFFDTCGCRTKYIPNQPDSVVDTVYSNAGDAYVLIDNQEKCHVWFSQYDYYDDDTTNTTTSIPYYGDTLFYWNEDMAADTGGARSYVPIATSLDLNGNGEIDLPKGKLTGCTSTSRMGTYGTTTMLQMPSAGIDADGKIFLTYQAIEEFPGADTTKYHIARRHVYMKTLEQIGGTYDASKWTPAVDLIPSIADGGDGENLETVYACTARKVDNNYAYVLYQRDDAPGHKISTVTLSCDVVKNNPIQSEIVLTRVDKSLFVGIPNTNSVDANVGQNYPNPSRGYTSFTIGLNKPSTVKVEVFNLIGKIVYSESKGLLASGYHTIGLNTTSWSKGVYVYSVTTNGVKTTRRMVVQ